MSMICKHPELRDGETFYKNIFFDEVVRVDEFVNKRVGHTAYDVCGRIIKNCVPIFSTLIKSTSTLKITVYTHSGIREEYTNVTGLVENKKARMVEFYYTQDGKRMHMIMEGVVEKMCTMCNPLFPITFKLKTRKHAAQVFGYCLDTNLFTVTLSRDNSKLTFTSSIFNIVANGRYVTIDKECGCEQFNTIIELCGGYVAAIQRPI